MNRTALGLAIGAGYLLGRTKKLKMAVAVGGLVAGKKLNLGPRMITDMVSTQLQKNPQFKELGDQLRGDLRGAGKAASGALVERQLDSLADKLHGRTTEMRDQLTGLGRPDREAEVDEDTEDDRRAEDDLEDEEATDEEPDDEEPEPAPERPAEKASSKRAPSKEAVKKTEKKAPARKTAPAKNRKTAPAKKTAGKKTAAARTTSSRGTRTSKGGGER
ncbi:DNA primase [Streptomyces cathayae]|uniref:DNA primase n=1 Tax=Streptomyces cathayae TaxID=3031124 RepID=A0ABY8JVY4_9ACTN|nr:DNA primase [Streptomyces sp. HUAS 5]WGD39594.1 DNA primase [Streptomyces sp. HUAS 5]